MSWAKSISIWTLKQRNLVVSLRISSNISYFYFWIICFVLLGYMGKEILLSKNWGHLTMSLQCQYQNVKYLPCNLIPNSVVCIWTSIKGFGMKSGASPLCGLLQWDPGSLGLMYSYDFLSTFKLKQLFWNLSIAKMNPLHKSTWENCSEGNLLHCFCECLLFYRGCIWDYNRLTHIP